MEAKPSMVPAQNPNVAKATGSLKELSRVHAPLRFVDKRPASEEYLDKSKSPVLALAEALKVSPSTQSAAARFKSLVISNFLP
jgi:hypothetical protein